MYLIGIAGGSASGKTTLIKKLTALFSEREVCVISQDHYYRPLSEQPVDKNGEVNFDRPEGIDFGRIRKDLKTLEKGKKAEIVEYTFNNPEKFPKSIVFHPAPIVIVEGLFIYTDEKLNKAFDLKLYVEARTDVMLERRMKRDAVERGMNREQIQYQWENHVLPSYEQFLLPYRENVDMIIVNNKHFDTSLQVLVDHFRKLLEN